MDVDRLNNYVVTKWRSLCHKLNLDGGRIFWVNYVIHSVRLAHSIRPKVPQVFRPFCLAGGQYPELFLSLKRYRTMIYGSTCPRTPICRILDLVDEAIVAGSRVGNSAV